MSDAGNAPQVSKEEQSWTMGCHLAALTGFIGIPFGNLLGPLIVWLVKRAEMPMVDQHGKESLNFQITVTIAMLISGVLCFVLIGFVLVPIVYIGALILTIMAAVKVSNGDMAYKYPLTIRLLK
jgi:uncharacterized Tic20 family protein